jgi:hypothetical protein
MHTYIYIYALLTPFANISCIVMVYILDIQRIAEYLVVLQIAAQQSCNKAATELQQSCNAADLQILRHSQHCGVFSITHYDRS